MNFSQFILLFLAIALIGCTTSNSNSDSDGDIDAIDQEDSEDETEAAENGALNFVTLGPRQILMAAGNPITQGFLESLGVTCHTVQVDELHKAAGGIGCLTGILERDTSLHQT